MLQIAWYVALAAAGVFLAIILLSIVSLSFRQFILRAGGTDTQWFWFSSEPRGLDRIRQQIRDTDKQ
jgi:hypothetical protein